MDTQELVGKTITEVEKGYNYVTIKFSDGSVITIKGGGNEEGNWIVINDGDF